MFFRIFPSDPSIRVSKLGDCCPSQPQTAWLVLLLWNRAPLCLLEKVFQDLRTCRLTSLLALPSRSPSREFPAGQIGPERAMAACQSGTPGWCLSPLRTGEMATDCPRSPVHLCTWDVSDRGLVAAAETPSDKCSSGRAKVGEPAQPVLHVLCHMG